MKTIGFTTVYYTLWNVSEPFEKPVFYNGMKIGSQTCQNFTYCQNLSHDLERAKAKLADQPYEIDLELRGHSSYTRVIGSNIKDRENYYDQDCFSFGRMEGVKISECTDNWQLWRAYSDEKSPRRRVWARRRLIQLGELTRYNWSETVIKWRNKFDNEYRNVNTGEVINIGKTHISDTKYESQAGPDGKVMVWDFIGKFEEEQYSEVVKHKYATKRQLENIKLAERGGHFFEDGKRISIEVKEFKSFSFEGAYGRIYVVFYETPEGNVVKYMGSSPCELFPDPKRPLMNKLNELYEQLNVAKHPIQPELVQKLDQDIKMVEDELDNFIAPERKEFVSIKATIKHGEYKGNKETKIQRIKLNNTNL